MTGKSPKEIVNELESAGIRLSARDGKIKLRGPSEQISKPEIAELVREHKPEIIAFLSGGSEPQPEPARENPAHEPTPEAPTKRCYSCRSYIFWKSVHGAVICAACHPPANRQLVKEWLWVCEGSSLLQ
jgi:hypothetical protein